MCECDEKPETGPQLMKSTRPGSCSGCAGGRPLPRPSSGLVRRKRLASPSPVPRVGVTKARPAGHPREQDRGLRGISGYLDLDRSGQEALEAGVLSTNELGPILSYVMYQDFLFFQRNLLFWFLR